MKILILTLIIGVSLFSKEYCIVNFNKKVCKDFKLLNGVIVKSPLSKEELKIRLNKPLKQIAFLDDTNLYLVKTDKPLEYSQELVKHSYIIYAQPDILQTRENSSVQNYDVSKEYNLKELWKITKGEGIKIAIIDDGFNLLHEDLKGVDLSFSYDADKKTLDAKPQVIHDTHGTQVAGIIFAQHNEIGINGIAPNASLIAIRQTTNISSDTVLSFTVAQKAGADIINCSWNSPLLLEPVYDVITHLSNKLAIVFAAGNNHKEITPLSIEASIDNVITVGTDKKYSNYGKVVDFTLDNGMVTTTADGSYGHFGGTSAAAPVVSGLLALQMVMHKNSSVQEISELVKRALDVK